MHLALFFDMRGVNMEVYKYSDEKFKSIYISYNITCEVKDTAIYSNYSVLGALLAKGSVNYPSQKAIEKAMANLYGANFHANVEKNGDLYNIEFVFEFINKEFLPDNEELVDKILDFMEDILYNPLDWKDENIQREKEFILERIKERKDDKLKYGLNRMEELLCQGEPFGNFLYGDEKTVISINKDVLKKSYEEIKKFPVTVIVSGNLKGYENIDDKIKEKLSKYTTDRSITELIANVSNNSMKNFEELSEYVDTAQSVVSLGYRINGATNKDYYALNMFNAILGTTPSSKLFQNVREKESLCYTIRSRYYRIKNLLIIFAGINKENYEKAISTISKQVDDMKEGNISDIEFNTAKDSLIAEIDTMKDLKVGMLKLIFANLITEKTPYITLDEYKEKMSAITKEDVVRVANMVDLEKIFFLGGEENA